MLTASPLCGSFSVMSISYDSRFNSVVHDFCREETCEFAWNKGVWETLHYSGALEREARSGAPWVRKCGKLPIQENLVITCPYTARPRDRPSAPQAYQCKIIQSTVMATQMQLEVILQSHLRLVNQKQLKRQWRGKWKAEIVSVSMFSKSGI